MSVSYRDKVRNKLDAKSRPLSFKWKEALEVVCKNQTEWEGRRRETYRYTYAACSRPASKVITVTPFHPSDLSALWCKVVTHTARPMQSDAPKNPI